jgi:hypothetical protein
MALRISKDRLRAQYVGKSLYQVPTPSVVLDLAKVEANCNLMLEAARRLNLSWRAEIKTHKVGEANRTNRTISDQLENPCAQHLDIPFSTKPCSVEIN